ILVLARGSSSHEIGFLSAGTGRFTMRPIPPVIVEDLSAGNPRLAHGGRVQGIGLTHHQFYSPSRERSRNTRRPGRTYQEAIRLRSTVSRLYDQVGVSMSPEGLLFSPVPQCELPRKFVGAHR